MDEVQIRGIVVTGADGSVAFASGLGRDARIRSLVADPPGWARRASAASAR